MVTLGFCTLNFVRYSPDVPCAQYLCLQRRRPFSALLTERAAIVATAQRRWVGLKTGDGLGVLAEAINFMQVSKI